MSEKLTVPYNKMRARIDEQLTAPSDKLVRVPLPLIEWKSPIRDFTDEDVKNMATSLRVHGQIQPIVCKPIQNGVYEGVCGRLRYEGAKYAKIPEILVRIHKFQRDSEVKAWQLAENLHRRDLTAIQKAEAYNQLYELAKEEVGGKYGEQIVSTIAKTQEDFSGEKSSEQNIRQYIQVAKDLPLKIKDKIIIDNNFGLAHGLQLLRLKDKLEKQIELVEDFHDSVIEDKPLTVKQLKKKVDKILNPPTEPKPLPEGLFNVIYADPPWRYDVKLRGTPEDHYQTMTLEDIGELKIPVSEDAVLFLWATNPMLQDALEIMRTWGFQYKTNLVWVKNKMGVGFYFRGQHELLLLGIKGNAHPPEQSNRFPSVVSANVGKHSEKPEEVYGIIEAMYPNSKYLELFARNKRESWEAWGNEV